MNLIKTKNGTELPLIDLKGKKYLQVQWRLVWFREEKPDWSIETILNGGDGYCMARAEIKDNTGRIIATSHKREDKAHFADYAEKAETGAIGRALALCGYGTQFAPDIDEQDRIVDSPAALPKADRVQQQVSAKPVPAAQQPEEIPYSDTPFEDYAPNMEHPLDGYQFPNVAKKYQGRIFKDVPKKELADYGRYMGEFLRKDGKEPKGAWAELIGNINTYVSIK